MGKPAFDPATGKPVFDPATGKPALNCGAAASPCNDCTSPTGGATSDGGKTPFSWGDTCTWMLNAVYDVPSSFTDNVDDCVWVYPMTTVNGGEANPQGVLVHLTYHKTAKTWDVEAQVSGPEIIYSVYGLAAATFICAAGELSGTAPLSADYCTGDPDATFTI